MKHAKTFKVENGDIVRFTRGTGYHMVSGRDKCRQDVKMIITTGIRASTGLGSSLEEAVGKDIDNPYNAYFNQPQGFEFKNRLSNSLNRLMLAQKRYQVGFRPASELIHDFSPVKLWRSETDERTFNWSIEIFTLDGRSNFTLRGTSQG